ncbi:hypothetical protein EGI22_05955 [Lacihabitans sp. LS3-19]|uniref:hypothetical protein n=1 Tax=Lacihabitans sp. LS3-19 TaxID=2487335 RepID=UPI0020CE2BA0|nr:hypothetical protein [Lacihabitans sp. LS3-19]MCP9767447.1 hypothetical protein [Lacihabitans sp. LS3-19]
MKKLFSIVIAFCFCSSVFAQSTVLSDYEGAFSFASAPFSKIVFSVENNTIYADAEGIGKGEIFSTNQKDEFSEPNNDAKLQFVRDDAGKVVKVIVKVQGSEMLGEKAADPLTEFVGEFNFDDDSPISSMTVDIRNGSLYGDTSEGGAPLKPSSTKDIFDVIGYEGTTEFLRDTTGKISGVILKVQGMNMKGVKK